MAELYPNKISKRKNSMDRCEKPMWKEKIEKKVVLIHGELSALTELQWGMEYKKKKMLKIEKEVQHNQ